jgi:hypothetical protein
VQAMRDCVSTLGIKKAKTLTGEYEWTECVNKKLTLLNKNITAQQEFRYAKLLKMCETHPELKQLAENKDNGIFYNVRINRQ